VDCSGWEEGKIRNPKSRHEFEARNRMQIRNPKQIQMTGGNIRNSKQESRNEFEWLKGEHSKWFDRGAVSVQCANVVLRAFSLLRFGLVSDFNIRASNFPHSEP
jgi:hypothetical protein